MTGSKNQKNIDNNQHEFINTIQKALGKASTLSPSELFGTRPEDLETRLRVYVNKSQPNRQELLETFIEQAGFLNMKVFVMENISQAGLAIQELIQQTEPEWGTQKSVIAWHHPLVEQLNLKKNLAGHDVTLFNTQSSGAPDSRERQETRNHLLKSYMGITSADFCVAQSATLVLRTYPDQPRAVSLVPSIHVAIIKIDQIIENLEELYFRLKWDPKEQERGLTNCMTFISGPSKTGDIELVMVDGAHGPRQMFVYVIMD